MKKILVLGAGLVAGPLVDYLLEQPEFNLTVADMIIEKAQKLVGNHPHGFARSLNLSDKSALKAQVNDADLVISMVPYTYHPVVARFCLESKKNLVTASYVSDGMKALDNDARKAGVIFLNEVGLDPGIDHMEAMRIIDEIKQEGGDVRSFKSFCGGLPAPEANTNPMGYKFSWSPLGVLLAGKNSARYLENGKEVLIPTEDLFTSTRKIDIEGLGVFDGYPNRNSLPYIDLYGIPSVETMLRGTLRYEGWCPTLQKFVDLGLLDQEIKDLKDLTYSGFIRDLMKEPSQSGTKEALADFMRIDSDSDILKRMEWLDLLSDKTLGIEKGSALDVLAERMEAKMQFSPGERDMIVMQHVFNAVDSAGRKSRVTSTLIDYGIPFGDSAMARTVGLPAAIGARLILEGKIELTGVHIPVIKEIYVPILEELKALGIRFDFIKEAL